MPERPQVTAGKTVRGNVKGSPHMQAVAAKGKVIPGRTVVANKLLNKGAKRGK